MVPQTWLASGILWGATLVMLLLGGVAWQRRSLLPGAQWFAGYCLGVALYAFFYSLEIRSADIDAAIRWTHWQYVGIVLLPPFGFLFVLHFSDHAHGFPRWAAPFLWIVPMLVLMLKWTDPYHGWVYADVVVLRDTPFFILSVKGGAGYWLQVVYQNLILALCLIMTMRFVCQSSAYARGQGLMVLTGIIAPWVGHLIYLLGLAALPLDYGPFGLAVSACFFGAGLLQFGLLRLEPIANARVIEGLRDAVVVLDAHQQVLLHNPAARRLFGRNERDPAGVSAAEYFGNAALEDFWGGDREEGRIEWMSPAGDASSLYVRCTPLPARYGQHRRGTVLTCTDITRQEAMERHWLSARKQEAIGRLAGGIAHDFNNQLMVILGHTDEALEHMRPDQPLHETMTVIKKAAERSAALTQQLLAFARRQPISPCEMDMNEKVGEACLWLQRLLGPDMHLAWHPSPKPARVRLDPSQLDHVLTSLCINARDTMQGKGTVTLSASDARFSEADLKKMPFVKPGEYHRLRLVDRGAGMSAEVLEHVFEPFFTTKELGQGLGMGLASVYGIVKQNNGFILVDSRLGKGTTVDLYFPAVEAHVP